VVWGQSLWHEAELTCDRPHDVEVAAIEGGDFIDLHPLGGGHDRRVDGPERQIPVRGYEIGDPKPVGRRDGLGNEVASGKVADEPNLGVNADARPEQVGHLRDDELGDDEGTGMGLEELKTCNVVCVVEVDVGVERTGVDNQRDAGTSAARISSIRSETSERPLLPAPAARSRRRGPALPRCASMAWRVNSETVVPRRSASCRRRASSSSGSFTEVRRMVCQHTAVASGDVCPAGETIPGHRRRHGSLTIAPRSCQSLSRRSGARLRPAAVEESGAR
jgi:hypothetical protein